MYRITFDLDLFDDYNRVESNSVLEELLKCLVMIDIIHLKFNPQTPDIYKSGVIYQAEISGQEKWQDIPTCMKLGHGDCEDLTCWRVAELFVKNGIKALPVFTYKQTVDGYLYHVFLKYPNGQVEDPSKILGMK